MFGDLTNRLSVQAVSHVRAMMNGDSGPSEDALDFEELLFWEGVLNQSCLLQISRRALITSMLSLHHHPECSKNTGARNAPLVE